MRSKGTEKPKVSRYPFSEQGKQRRVKRMKENVLYVVLKVRIFDI